MKTMMIFDYNPVGSFNWKNPNPYTIAFIYSKDKSFVVKGGMVDVKKYLNTVMKHTPYIVHYTMWHKGKFRTIIDFENFSVYDIFHITEFETNRKVEHIIAYDRLSKTRTVVASFKRFPRKWIKQLDDFIN